MYKTIIFAILFQWISISVFAQATQDSIAEISLVFMGDIMGHDAQLQSAYNSLTDTYDYKEVFAKVSPLIRQADFAIANLEVTLAGKPYSGYPQFSSPPQLAEACRESGIDVLLNANNHACDRRKDGIIHTIMTLDSLHIKHIGSYLDSADRASRNLLVLSKNGIRVGLLNYTYGTNGIPVTPPTIVNRIDTAQMAKDLRASRHDSLDKRIVILHWGKEYHPLPDSSQKALAGFLFSHGADIIIGSHPHVIQPMKYIPATDSSREHLIVYSLGNFVSNQRTQPRDGGAMFTLQLRKKDGKCFISQKGYSLTWVHKYKQNGKYHFEILPAAAHENNPDLEPAARQKLKAFLKNSRNLLHTYNAGISGNDVQTGKTRKTALNISGAKKNDR